MRTDEEERQVGAIRAHAIAGKLAAEMTPAWAEYGHLARLWDWLHLEKVDPELGIAHLLSFAYRRGVEDAAAGIAPDYRKAS